MCLRVNRLSLRCVRKQTDNLYLSSFQVLNHPENGIDRYHGERLSHDDKEQASQTYLNRDWTSILQQWNRLESPHLSWTAISGL
jgi:hypothetical protein